MPKIIKIETVLIDGELHPDIFVVQRLPVFDMDGKEVGMGQNHRASIKLDRQKIEGDDESIVTVDEQLEADPVLSITAKEAKVINEHIAATKAATVLVKRALPETGV